MKIEVILLGGQKRMMGINMRKIHYVCLHIYIYIYVVIKYIIIYFNLVFIITYIINEC